MDIFERFNHFFVVTKGLFDRGYRIPRRQIESQCGNGLYWHLDGSFGRTEQVVLAAERVIEECLCEEVGDGHI